MTVATVPAGGRAADPAPHDRWRWRAHELDTRLRALVGSGGALRRLVAALAGRFVAIQGWAELGAARLGDHARERLGLSARQMQELARTDAALAELPRVEATLVAGEITWTHAVLLARVASVENEELWLARARRSTLAGLRYAVRRVDQGALEAGAAAMPLDDPEHERRVGVRLGCTPEVQAKWWRARQLAKRVAGENLPWWGCAEAVAAEVLSGLGEELRMPDGPPLAFRSPLPRRARLGSLRRSCAAQERRSDRVDPARLPELLRGLAHDFETADARELDARLRRAIAFEQSLDARIGPLLRELAESRCFRGLGFRSLASYAEERLGMSEERARDLLRIERVGDRCLALREAYRQGRLSWVQATKLLPALVLCRSHERAEEWVAWAGRVTLRRLEEDVERALLLHESDWDGWVETGGLPSEARSGVHRQVEGSSVRAAGAADATDPAGRELSAQPREYAEKAQVFFSAPRDVAQLFRDVLCTLRLHMERATGRLPTEGEALGAMCDHVSHEWDRRPLAAHKVFARDGWRCAIPGCTSFRNLHDHHVRFRSAGGSNELDNRITLCAAHHLRGVHAGLVAIRGRAPDALVFELGVRPGASPLERFRSGDVRLPPGV